GLAVSDHLFHPGVLNYRHVVLHLYSRRLPDCLEALVQHLEQLLVDGVYPAPHVIHHVEGLQRGFEGLDLQVQLGKFVGGIGSDDDPAAGMEVQLAMVEVDDADADTGLYPALTAKETDGSAIGATSVLFELIDDLHRTN